MTKNEVLGHRADDLVAVAVADLAPGTRSVTFLDDSQRRTVVLSADVPLGHKVALADVAMGDEVIEYGVVIGRATAAIASGDHVHTHNLKGVRWA